MRLRTSGHYCAHLVPSDRLPPLVITDVAIRSEELDIDPKDIMYKLRSVIMPYNVDREVLVRSPDFWGPLLVVMLYAIFVIKFSVRPTLLPTVCLISSLSPPPCSL